MRKSRLSRQQQGKLMEHFVAGTTARTAAGLVRVNKTAAAYYYHRLQDLIYQAIEEATPFTGEIEVDESCFGGHRKGKRGRGAAGKVPVFGLLKRGGKVYAVVIADAKPSRCCPS
jgi:transposase